MALADLQKEAYRAVLRAVAATQLDWSKEKLLTDLRKELGISSQEHFMVLEKVMSDKEVEALRENRPPEGQAQPDAGLGKKRKDSAPLSGARPEKKLSKKPRHLELQEVGLESPSTPAAMASPADTPLGGLGPGQRMSRPGQLTGSYPGTGGFDVKRGPGRPAGRMDGIQSADVKRGPGRPPARSAPGLSSTVGRPGRKAKSGLAAASYTTNELVGRKIWRYWPLEENPWAEGLITDYREDTEEHCIVYNISTPDEAFEWFRIKDASSPEEYQLVEGYAEGVQDVVQGYQAKVAGLGQSTTTRHPGGRGGGKRGGKGGRGLGRPPSAKTADMLAMANGMMPLAPPGGASLGCPYGAKHLAGKLARGTAAELQTMIQMLNLRAAEIAMEMQTLQDLDKDGLESRELLQLHLKDLGSRERAVHAQLAALNEDSGDDWQE
ncbi:hypothetical protein CVIRNUC_004871 [Coccomyxa viridis]|uniref:ENT domain-containing protein n=1 Tax=Coccomyxa viridis TaxID=1274662 RepID=A0AAV1I787_9CHLO|nr:hypothetical protein CVIRNUC_004871 [Coccomyxa viridis]